jgi:hypothetical protein
MMVCDGGVGGLRASDLRGFEPGAQCDRNAEDAF